jgi:hypothetical protein
VAVLLCLLAVDDRPRGCLTRTTIGETTLDVAVAMVRFDVRIANAATAPTAIIVFSAAAAAVRLCCFHSTRPSSLLLRLLVVVLRTTGGG